MPTIETTTLPAHAALHRYVQPGDFIDCYRYASTQDIDTALAAAFTMPRWVQVLMQLRNTIVAPLGLKSTVDGEKKVTPAHFPVLLDTETERHMGLDDSHLDFRICVLRDGAQIYMSTWVHPHNWMGRSYLFLIMPFHRAIVRNSMQRVAALG